MPEISYFTIIHTHNAPFLVLIKLFCSDKTFNVKYIILKIVRMQNQGFPGENLYVQKEFKIIEKFPPKRRFQLYCWRKQEVIRTVTNGYFIGIQLLQLIWIVLLLCFLYSFHNINVLYPRTLWSCLIGCIHEKHFIRNIWRFLELKS